MSTRMVAFDMDGTLVQARSAAWEVFQDTAAEFSLPIRSAEQFFDLFRSNFFEELDRLCADPDLARRVREHFMIALRERYTPRLVPGMADVVKALAPHYALSVVSSNAMEAIRRTLDAAGLAHCFAHVFSADVDPSKAGHLRRVLSDPAYAEVRRCSAAYAEDDVAGTGGDEIVLITDTVGDVTEGIAAGVRVFGVAWGMHSEESLRAAGAEFVACWPQELISRLLPEGSCRAGGCTCTTGSCATTGTCSIPAGDLTERLGTAALVRSARRTAAPIRVAVPDPVTSRPPVRVASGARPAARSPEPALAAALARIAGPPPTSRPAAQAVRASESPTRRNAE